jgi:hypothetical protein
LSLEERQELEADEQYKADHDIDQGPKRCPGGFTHFPPDFVDNITCINCLQRRRKYGERPASCEWSGWAPEDPDAQLHKDYPHTFKDGKLNRTQASFELDVLMAKLARGDATEKEREAIEHIRAHLGIPSYRQAPEPIEAVATTPGVKTVDPDYIAQEDVEKGDLIIVLKPWTDEELHKLRLNATMSPKSIAKYVLPGRSEAIIAAKLKELTL